jgi:hypothetical protein
LCVFDGDKKTGPWWPVFFGLDFSDRTWKIRHQSFSFQEAGLKAFARFKQYRAKATQTGLTRKAGLRLNALP